VQIEDLPSLLIFWQLSSTIGWQV